MKRSASCFFLLAAMAAMASAADRIVCAPERLADWEGNTDELLCQEGVFDTNKSRFRLASRKKVRIVPGRTYVLEGDFKLKTYAPFGNIRLGVRFLDADGSPIREESYIGASPYDDRVASGNRAQVRRFWLTFSGRLPSANGRLPENAVFLQIILRPQNSNIVDMLFKNIRLTEKG